MKYPLIFFIPKEVIPAPLPNPIGAGRYTAVVQQLVCGNVAWKQPERVRTQAWEKAMENP